MILVFIFCGFIAIITIFFLILIMSNLKIKVENLKIENLRNNNRYKIFIQLYFFNKIKIASFKLDEKRLEKIYTNTKFKQIEINNFKLDKEILKQLKIKFEQLNLIIVIGFEKADITSYLVSVVSTFISIILPFVIKSRDSKVKYAVKPIFDKNILNISLESIINIKMVNIIIVIFKLVKKGRDENERTSNRRSYGYSHGFN